MGGYATELTTLRELARQAAAMALELRKGDLEVAMKGTNDPVTRADRELNAFLGDAIARAFPDAGFVGEESAPSNEELSTLSSRHERLFFVDPIDGTREYADGSSEYCVMLGLAERGRAVAGVVAIPEESLLFWGDGESGTFVEPLGGGLAQRCTLTERSETELLTAVVSRSHPARRTSELLDALGVSQRVGCGSVGVKVARLLTGRADLYVHTGGGAKLWDSCAPEALMLGAGGKLTAVDGTDIDYRGPLELSAGLLASSAALVVRCSSIARGMGLPSRAGPSASTAVLSPRR